MEDGIKRLKEKFAENVYEMEQIYAKADKDGRELLDPIEQESFDKAMKANDEIEKNITNLEAIEKADFLRADKYAQAADIKGMSEDEHKSAHTKAFEKYLKSKPLTSEERGLIQNHHD